MAKIATLSSQERKSSIMYCCWACLSIENSIEQDEGIGQKNLECEQLAKTCKRTTDPRNGLLELDEELGWFAP